MFDSGVTPSFLALCCLRNIFILVVTFTLVEKSGHNGKEIEIILYRIISVVCISQSQLKSDTCPPRWTGNGRVASGKNAACRAEDRDAAERTRRRLALLSGIQKGKVEKKKEESCWEVNKSRGRLCLVKRRYVHHSTKMARAVGRIVWLCIFVTTSLSAVQTEFLPHESTSQVQLSSLFEKGV